MLLASVVAAAALGMWISRQRALRAREAARVAADPAVHVRRQIDDLGVELGVAPSPTAALGEHVLVTSRLVRIVGTRDDGRIVAEYVPDWSTATWYDADGFATDRTASPTGEDGDFYVESAITGSRAPETATTVFTAEVKPSGNTAFVIADGTIHADPDGRITGFTSRT